MKRPRLEFILIGIGVVLWLIILFGSSLWPARADAPARLYACPKSEVVNISTGRSGNQMGIVWTCRNRPAYLNYTTVETP